MQEQSFEQYAAEIEQEAVARQIRENSVSFIEHQARAWSEIQKWWVEAQGFGKPPETANGPGSTLEATEQIRKWLSNVLARYKVRTMLDAPCGDWNWFSRVDVGDVEYTGWDSSEWLLERCRQKVEEINCQADVIFERVNILTVPEIPAYDLILCRDFLAHLPNGPIQQVIQKFKDSGSCYLLASNYPELETNEYVYRPQDFTYFGYVERPVNLEITPFSLHKVEAVAETPGPGGVISQPHELGLFELAT